jgi:hypothetical protein
LLRNVKVQEALAARQEKLAANVEVTAEWILHRLWEEATSYGQGSTHAARVRALELLGKRLKLFAGEPENLPTGTLRITAVVVDRADHWNDVPPAQIPT